MAVQGLVVCEIVFVGVLSSLVTSEGASTFCVKPSENVVAYQSEGKRLQQDCLETKTWNEYLADQSRYFSSVADFNFIFFPGEHDMNRSLEANNTNDLLITGSASDNVRLTSSLTGISTPLIFNKFSNIIIEGITIKLCASIPYDRGLLFFINGKNASVRDSVLDNVCNGSEIHAEQVLDVSILHVHISKLRESECGSVCFPNVSGDIQIVNSTLLSSVADPTGKFVFLYFGESLMVNSSITIERCKFTCQNVLTINLANTSALVIRDVLAYGCAADSYMSAFSFQGTKGQVFILNSKFQNYSGAVYVNNIKISIANTLFDSNSPYNGGFLIDRLHASALSIYDSRATLFNVTFLRNGNGDVAFTRPNSSALLLHGSSLYLNTCNFSQNIGHALYSFTSNLYFSGFVGFVHNRGYEGAAVYLNVDKNSNMHYSYGTILFQSNIAEYTGGAIHITDMDPNNPACPFISSTRQNSGLTFLNNSANSGGNDIYGGSLDWATAANNETLRCIQIIRQSSRLSNNMSSISSKQSRVCFCNSTTNKAKCLKVFNSTKRYPGEDITLSLVAVGQTFGTSAGYVNAQLLLFNDSLHASLGDEQQYQVVQPHRCNNPTYTVHAQPGLVILVLTTQIELIQSYGNEEEVNASIKEYNENHREFVPKSLLFYPVYINVTLRPCPSGYELSHDAPYTCTCFPRLLEIEGVKCLIGTKELERSGTVWIGNNEGDSSVAVLFSKYCPYNYCKPAKINIFNSSAAQCQWNHTGRLCGECPKGMSLTLGTSQCRQCSNTNLYLLAIFAFGGVALVTFLKVTDLTTAGGLINGLILYANLVKSGTYIYFPPTSNVIYLKLLKVFVDWVNLDFGIEVCFFNGLDGFWKTWLQLAFPLYLWMISLTMILLARYSIKMSRLLGNNSVPVLATLFTLSYAKIFRFIITAMKYTILEDVSGHSTAVWSYDGSIGYFSMRHSVLFIVAVLVLLFFWLPYTCVLLFVQWIQRCRIQCISTLVSKMQPLLDAHCGPFRDKHRYWFGLLLVARAIPALVVVLSTTNTEINAVLSTVVLVGLLFLLQNRVYRKLYVSLSESFFLLNILFLAGSVLYTQSTGSSQYDQPIFTAILTGIAFLQFVAIVLFNTANHLRMVCYRREWTPLSGANVNISDLDSYSYQRDRPKL